MRFLHLIGVGYLIDFIQGLNQSRKDRDESLREYVRMEEAESYISGQNLANLDRQMRYDNAGILDDYLKNEAFGAGNAPLTKDETQDNVYESRKKRQG